MKIENVVNTYKVREQSSNVKVTSDEFVNTLSSELSNNIAAVAKAASSEVGSVLPTSNPSTVARITESKTVGIDFKNAISIDEYLELLKNPPVQSTDQINTIPPTNHLVGKQTSKYDDIIQTACDKYGVDPKIIQSIIKNESNFNPKAISGAGAMGLMQLMPVNIREYNVTDPFDPEQNINAGVKHFKDYFDRYNGDLTLTLAAYNAGPGNVKKYGGVPPFKETQNYIQKVMNTYNSL